MSRGRGGWAPALLRFVLAAVWASACSSLKTHLPVGKTECVSTFFGVEHFQVWVDSCVAGFDVIRLHPFVTLADIL
jgi:hypothetical protein